MYIKMYNTQHLLKAPFKSIFGMYGMMYVLTCILKQIIKKCRQ